MAITEYPSLHSLFPGLLYSSSSTRSLALEHLLSRSPSSPAPSPPSPVDPPSIGRSPPDPFLAQAPSEPGKIELYSPLYYAACTAGGIASCGLTHMAVTPLDLVKCNMQARFRSLEV